MTNLNIEEEYDKVVFKPRYITCEVENMSVEEKLVYYQKREQELLASLEFYDKVHAMQAKIIRKYERQITNLNESITVERNNNRQLLEDLGDALFELYTLDGTISNEPMLETMEELSEEDKHPAP